MDKLLENGDAGWTREGPEALGDGFENSGYYLAVVIPEDFSKRIAAGKGSSLEQAGITFHCNMRMSYMLGTLSSRIESKLSETVNQKVAEEYAEALASGLVDARNGFDEAASGAGALLDGLKSLEGGTDEAIEGAGTLSASATSVNAGADGVSSGAAAANDGAGALSENASALADGAKTVSGGLASLAANNDALASGWGTLEGGIDSLASFFMTLCLWLGTLLIFFVFDPFPSYRHIGVGRFAAVFGRWPLYLAMVALEIAVVCGGSILLGVPHTDLAAYVLNFCALGFSFMCIMQLLNLFDIPGKAVAILILIFQICCGSGTFPVILGADYAQAVGGFLPFTYGIDAFREILSGNNLAVAYADMGVVLLFGAGAVVLTLLVYPHALKLKMKRDREILSTLSPMPNTRGRGKRVLAEHRSPVPVFVHRWSVKP